MEMRYSDSDCENYFIFYICFGALADVQKYTDEKKRKY